MQWIGFEWFKSITPLVQSVIANDLGPFLNICSSHSSTFLICATVILLKRIFLVSLFYPVFLLLLFSPPWLQISSNPLNLQLEMVRLEPFLQHTDKYAYEIRNCVENVEIHDIRAV